MRTLLLLLALVYTLQAAPTDVPICGDVKSLRVFNGRDVSFEGRLTLGMHGGSLRGAKCGDGSYSGGWFESGESGAPKVDFRTEVNYLKLVRPFMNQEGHGSVCGTFSGRLFVKKDFYYDPSRGNTANGLGALGRCPWTLVLRSISNLHRCAP